MAAITGNHLGGQICEIFGLSRVMSLSLTCNLNEAATIHAEIATDKIQGDELVTLLKKYELHEIQLRDWIDERADQIKAELAEMAAKARTDCAAISIGAIAELGLWRQSFPEIMAIIQDGHFVGYANR